MKKLTEPALLTTIAAGACGRRRHSQWAAGSAGNGEAPHSGAARRHRRSQAGSRAEGGRGRPPRRDPMGDDETTVQSYSVLTKTPDGKETHTGRSDALKEIILQSIGSQEGRRGCQALRRRPGDCRRQEASRHIGPDDRVQVANTKIYPFTVIGYEHHRQGQGRGLCILLGHADRAAHLTPRALRLQRRAPGLLDDVLFVPWLKVGPPKPMRPSGGCRASR